MSKAVILIVEDESIIALDISNSLEANGYQVAGQTDRGEEAIKKAGELQPNLVLMDIGLKGKMDGIEAAKQIRDKFDIPIIFLTAFADETTIKHAREAEPYGYILKPFTERELASNIEMALYKHGMERKLRESNEYYRVLIETSPDAIGLYDLRQGKIVTVNQKFLNQHCFSRIEELQASNWTMDFVIESDRARMQENVTAALTRNISQLIEITARRLDGSTFPAEFNSSVLRDTQGNPTALMFVSRDISARKQTEEALRESQSLYHSLVEVSPLSICRKDLEGRFTFANQRFLELSNISLDDLLGKTDFELHPPELAVKYRSDDQAILESGQVRELIEERAVLGGKSIIIQTIKTPIYDGTGKINGVQISFWDITERKRAEDALRKNEERLRVITENAPAIIAELDIQGQILYMSRVLPGNKMEDVLGKNIVDWIVPEYRDILLQNLEHAIKEGKPQSYEAQGAGAHGEIRWYLSNLSPVIGTDGIKNIILVTSDITERKRAEAELRKLTQAVDQSANVIVVTDLEGHIEYANPKFAEITGYSIQEALGKNPRLLHSGEHNPEFYQNLWQTIKSGEIWHGEFHNQRKDGSLYWEDATIAPVFDPSGNIINFIAVKEDITARKALEAAEHDQRQLAEALRDTAMALNSSLQLDNVLDRILENVIKLVPYDTAMVLLVEGYTVRKIRSRSNETHNKISQPQIGNTQANLINVPILQEMQQTRQPSLIPDTQSDPRWRAIPGMGWVRSFISAPVEILGQIDGLINIISAEPNFFTPLHAERLMAFASQAAVAIEHARLFEQTRQLSITDSLTELYNRRHFFEIAALEFERTRRYNRALSVMMIDVDYFKGINDAHGHAVGDLALCEIVARITSLVRVVDIVARYGGEEFVVLMPETGLNEARQIAERVRRNVADYPTKNNDAIIPVTISLGVAEINKNTKNLDELINNADQALYKAKANGRNCVESYSPGG